MSHDARQEELAAGLSRVRSRISGACAAAGRSSTEVTLIVVTKYFPADDVRALHELGVRDVGENKHQEAQAKAEDLADLGTDRLGADGLRWHFIGNMQSNKAAAIAGYADVVHSVDRVKLLAPLARGAAGRGRRLDVLLQVNLDPSPTPGRGGVVPDQLAALADATAGTDGLRLCGLMAVAPLGLDPAPCFRQLQRLSTDTRAAHPDCDWLSAGMSGDLEAAIAAGATHVRVGSAILGPRPVW